ncbi:MAG: hypothetical protein ACMG57_01870 [Candidatus Dojkabacteria bacterium]
MSYKIAITKYRAVVNPTEVFEFDASVSIPSDPKAVFFLNDFLNPEALSPNNKILSSELIFKIADAEEVKISRDYQNNTITTTLNGEVLQKPFFSVVSEKLNVSLDAVSWSKLVIDCVKNNISTIDQLKSLVSIDAPLSGGDLESLIAKAAEGLTPEELEKVKRLRDTNLKINSMDLEVGTYQNQKKDKEDIKKKKEIADREVKNIEDKLSSVKLLIDNREHLVAELEKFKSYTGNLDVRKKVDVIKDTRTNNLITELKTRKKTSGVNMETEEKEGSLFVGKWMVGLVVFQLLLSIVMFALTLQLIQLLIGLFSAVVIVVLMLLINVSRYTYDYKVKKFIESDMTGTSYSTVMTKSSPEEEKLMVNFAWGNALYEEYKLINNTINSRLGDKNLAQLTKDKEFLIGEQGRLDKLQNDMETKALNTEEYYKKRRELDILKIEKENIEFSLEGKVNSDIEEQITTLSLNKTQQTPSNQFLPLILVNCGFLDQIKDFIDSIKQTRQILTINFQ